MVFQSTSSLSWVQHYESQHEDMEQFWCCLTYYISQHYEGQHEDMKQFWFCLTYYISLTHTYTQAPSAVLNLSWDQKQISHSFLKAELLARVQELV